MLADKADSVLQELWGRYSFWYSPADYLFLQNNANIVLIEQYLRYILIKKHPDALLSTSKDAFVYGNKKKS